MIDPIKPDAADVVFDCMHKLSVDRLAYDYAFIHEYDGENYTITIERTND